MKIKMEGLCQGDIAVISNALSNYANTLQLLVEMDNRSQQHIHQSILTEFRYDILKKLTKREPSSKNSLKMEIHTSFVLYDALHHYSMQPLDGLEAAVVRRLIMELFAYLPYTKDHEKMSINSQLTLKE